MKPALYVFVAVCLTSASALNLRTDVDSYVERHACYFANQIALSTNEEEILTKTFIGKKTKVFGGKLSMGYPRVTGCQVDIDSLAFTFSGTAAFIGVSYLQNKGELDIAAPELQIPYYIHATAEACTSHGLACGIKNIKLEDGVEIMNAKGLVDDGPTMHLESVLKWMEHRLS